ncbi:universal stress protein [Parapedobacter lycopersici]|uniref:universal stress protein n=1 Tax=Parapedobacter lycopersici TaxID=1864939 RepID=UPI00214D805B|nr:universal stress protein [Parapedobacter lycopersici]
MNTFLVPVDFSDVSYNAAQYAVDMAGELKALRLIFYHSYKEAPVDRTRSEQGRNPYHEVAMKHLDTMVSKLHRINDMKDRILLLADDQSVKAGVEAIVNIHQVSIIIMGIAGLSDIENTLIGRHTLAVAESGIAPLLIVPRDHLLRSIKKVAYATDLVDVETETPINSIVQLVSPFRAEMHILHVDYALKRQSPATLLGQKQLMRYLDELTPVFETISTHKDTATGIFDYVKKQHIDLVLIASKNYGILRRLFHSSVRKKLLNITDVPVVLLKKKRL